MPLNPGLAEDALTSLGGRLGLDSQATAQAILDVATSNMYAQFTPLMARKGVDPRDFVLLAYGGAGPTHAFLFAREVGIRRVLIPPSPGTLCALGCIVADLRSDFVRTMYKGDYQLTDADLEQAFADLEAAGRTWLAAESAHGITLESSYALFSADMRYEGQAFEIEVSIPDDRRSDVGGAVRLFHQQYHNLFGISDPKTPVTFINLRTTVVGVTQKIDALPLLDVPEHAALRETRPVFYDGRLQQAEVLHRSALRPGEDVAGPAIIEQYDTTTFVPAGFRVGIDAFGNLVGEAA